MRFNKQFPSLKDENRMFTTVGIGYPLKVIKDCCLDKVKVKEIIKQYEVYYYNNGEMLAMFKCIKEELGILK